jgi:glycosyltransferase involved in cell wall biosynthesis
VQFKACVNLGCNVEKIIVLPWVDAREMEKFVKKAKEERSTFRERFNWRTDDLIVISTRMHEKIYNVETLIRAIPIVLRNVPNVRFLLLGGGSLTWKLKSMVHELGVQEAVQFIGFVPHDEIFYYLKNSDIYVSTSLSDGTSASLLEAMISGLACLVSNIPGNREWIYDGENGILFPVRDHEKLAQKIILLAEDKNLRKKLGEKASITVRERANWEKNSKILYERLESIIKMTKNFKK